MFGEVNRESWIPQQKGPVTRKMFPFDDVIMTNLTFVFAYVWISIFTGCQKPVLTIVTPQGIIKYTQWIQSRSVLYGFTNGMSCEALVTTLIQRDVWYFVNCSGYLKISPINHTPSISAWKKKETRLFYWWEHPSTIAYLPTGSIDCMHTCILARPLSSHYIDVT